MAGQYAWALTWHKVLIAIVSESFRIKRYYMSAISNAPYNIAIFWSPPREEEWGGGGGWRNRLGVDEYMLKVSECLEEVSDAT